MKKYYVKDLQAIVEAGIDPLTFQANPPYVHEDGKVDALFYKIDQPTEWRNYPECAWVAYNAKQLYEIDDAYEPSDVLDAGIIAKLTSDLGASEHQMFEAKQIAKLNPGQFKAYLTDFKGAQLRTLKRDLVTLYEQETNVNYKENILLAVKAINSFLLSSLKELCVDAIRCNSMFAKDAPDARFDTNKLPADLQPLIGPKK